MTAILIAAGIPVLAGLGLLVVAHAWYPERYPTTARIGAAVVTIGVLVGMILRVRLG